MLVWCVFFFFQAEDGIRDQPRSRGLGDVYKRQVIIGMIIAMEEQKAKGKDIPGDFITSLKTSMMGPLSGVGDTIYQGVLIPILLAICILSLIHI
ncbi:Mannose permease IID component [Lactobacillus casei W56] [Lacticaseibacillus rhamnosus]|nr:Mannose permease IID component [Lactobacillus casei W56] [Lacticaseibacillus rhamnosus]